MKRLKTVFTVLGVLTLLLVTPLTAFAESVDGGVIEQGTVAIKDPYYAPVSNMMLDEENDILYTDAVYELDAEGKFYIDGELVYDMLETSEFNPETWFVYRYIYKTNVYDGVGYYYLVCSQKPIKFKQYEYTKDDGTVSVYTRATVNEYNNRLCYHKVDLEFNRIDYGTFSNPNIDWYDVPIEDYKHMIVYANHTMTYYDTGETFFTMPPLTLQAQLPTKTQGVKMTEVLTETLKLLPVGLGCLVGFLALRKALSTLGQTLSQA